VMVAVVLLALPAGCAHGEPSAQAKPVPIHFVVIDDGVSDSDVQTRAGEEVRWVNVRATPVSIEFNGLRHGEVSCARGFSNSTNAHLTAVILPDHNASLCFSKAGQLTYRVVDVQRPGVELNHSATIHVAGADEGSS
jgi:hypothetical protein